MSDRAQANESIFRPTRRDVLALVLAVATVTAGACAALDETPDRRAGDAAHPMTCQFEPGDAASYRLVMRRVVHATKGDVSALGPDHTHLRGELHWRVVSKTPEGSHLLAASFEDVAVEVTSGRAPALAAAAPRPFMVTVGSDCRFEDFGFAPGATDPVARATMELMRELEIVLPHGSASSQWAVQQETAHGTTLARYRPFGDSRQPTVTRHRTGFRATSGPAPVVHRSDAHVSLAAGGRWLDALRSRDEIGIPGADGEEAARVVSILRIWKDDALTADGLKGLQANPEMYAWQGGAKKARAALATTGSDGRMVFTDPDVITAVVPPR